MQHGVLLFVTMVMLARVSFRDEGSHNIIINNIIHNPTEAEHDHAHELFWRRSERGG